MEGHRRSLGVKDLTIVGCVIGVAAAILAPVGINAKGLPSRAICLSNLKKLSMAVLMYAQDNDEALPSVDTSVNTLSEPARGVAFCGDLGIESPAALEYARNDSIRARLSQYAGQPALWSCPADEECHSEMAVNYRWTSYAYRLYIAEAPVTPFPKSLYRVSDFAHPESNFIFSEQQPFHEPETATLSWTGDKGWSPSAMMNFSFLDGHAKAVPMERIVLKNKGIAGGWDIHWPRDVSTGERSAWTSETRDMAATE